MKHNYQYDGADLLLRPLEEKDIESLRLLRNRPENRIWFFGSDLITPEGQRAWFEHYLTKEDDYMFSVFLPEAPDKFVGAVALYGYEPETNSFEIGRLLLDSKNLPRRRMGIQLVAAVCKLAEQIGERERDGSDSSALKYFPTMNDPCAVLPKTALKSKVWQYGTERKSFSFGRVQALRAEVYSDNERSLRCFLKNDFVIDGTTEENGKKVILLSRRICK